MDRSAVESFLIRWNVMFPLDREFRKTNNIVFGSSKHREINQIDLYFQSIENDLYKKILEEIKQEKEDEEQIKKGKWLRDRERKEDQALFDKIDISLFDKEKVD